MACLAMYHLASARAGLLCDQITQAVEGVAAWFQAVRLPSVQSFDVVYMWTGDPVVTGMEAGVAGEAVGLQTPDVGNPYSTSPLPTVRSRQEYNRVMEKRAAAAVPKEVRRCCASAAVSGISGVQHSLLLVCTLMFAVGSGSLVLPGLFRGSCWLRVLTQLAARLPIYSAAAVSFVGIPPIH